MAKDLKKTAKRFGIAKVAKTGAKLNDLAVSSKARDVRGGGASGSSHGCPACPHPGVLNPHTGASSQVGVRP